MNIVKKRVTVNNYCCSIEQIHAHNESRKQDILSTMSSHTATFGRRCHFIIALIPGEEKLVDTVKKIGFKEVVEFSRRKQYNQDIRLKMFFMEPNVTGDNKNMIVLPNESKKASKKEIIETANLTLVSKCYDYNMYRSNKGKIMYTKPYGTVVYLDEYCIAPAKGEFMLPNGKIRTQI